MRGFIQTGNSIVANFEQLKSSTDAQWSIILYEMLFGHLHKHIVTHFGEVEKKNDLFRIHSGQFFFCVVFLAALEQNVCKQTQEIKWTNN